MNITKSRLAVVAAGALVIVAAAGTGGAVAGAMITSADIQDKTIQKWDLAPGSVTSGKIVDGTIGLNDISATAKSSLTGAPGAAGVVQVPKSRDVAAGGTSNFDDLNCPAGTFLISLADGDHVTDDNYGLAFVSAGNVDAFSADVQTDSDGNPIGLDNIVIGSDSANAFTATAHILCG